MVEAKKKLDVPLVEGNVTTVLDDPQLYQQMVAARAEWIREMVEMYREACKKEEK